MENIQALALNSVVDTPKPELINPKRPETNDRPDFYLPSEESLDFLLDHQIDTMERLELFLDRKAADDLNDKLHESWCWFSDFLESLQWFINLSDQALDSRTLTAKCLETNPEFAPQRAVFSGLLDDVMAAYMAAKRQTLPYNDQTGDCPLDAIIELLRRYWLFVRQVKAFANEVWPGFYLRESPNPVELHQVMCRRFAA